jgi:RNA polymerase sigma-70 factor (ECF subfamily)
LSPDFLRARVTKDFLDPRHRLNDERFSMSVEQELFREVYSEHVGAIRAYLHRRVASSEVEDLSADVFAVAWRKRATVTKGEELPWLYTIASYIVANHRRKERNRLDVLWMFTRPDSAPAADAFLEGDPELASAWRALPLAQRELLALVVIDGIAIKDVAQVLRITPNAVSIRLHRAKKTLADALVANRSERNNTVGT